MVTHTYGIGGDELPEFVKTRIKSASLDELEMIRSLHPGLWINLNRCSRCECLVILYPERIPKPIVLPNNLRTGSIFLGSEPDVAGKEPPKHVSTKLCVVCVQEFDRQEQEINKQRIELCKKFSIPYPYRKF